MRVARLAVIAVLLGCRQAATEEQLERAALREDLVGCWVLERVDGAALATDATFLGSIIELDSTLLLGREAATYTSTARRIRQPDSALDSVLASTAQGRLAVPRWTSDSLTDTVRLHFSLGLSSHGFALYAPGGADTLRGRSSFFFDGGPSLSAGPVVRAVRRGCPDPVTAAT